MKTTMTTLLVILLAGVFAAAAIAQDEETPTQAKEQAQEQVQERQLNYDDAPGQDANGGIVRNGGDYAEEGGPHGPVGPGPDDEEDGEDTVKSMFIDEDGDGFCDGKQGDGDGDGDGTMNQVGEMAKEQRKLGAGEQGPHDETAGGFGEANDREASNEDAATNRNRSGGRR